MFHDGGRGVTGLENVLEVQSSDCSSPWKRFKIDLGLRYGAKSTLRAHDYARKVKGVGIDKFVEVVTADTAHDLRIPGLYLRTISLCEPRCLPVNMAQQTPARQAMLQLVWRLGPKPRFRSVGENGVQLHHLVESLAEQDRVRAARVVAYPTPDGRAVHRRGVGGIVKSVFRNLSVEGGDYNARLYAGPALLRINLQQPVQIPAEVQDYRVINGLSRKAGARTPGKDRYAFPVCKFNDSDNIIDVPRSHYSNGGHLVDAGVGAVKGTRKIVKPDLARHPTLKLRGQLACEARFCISG